MAYRHICLASDLLKTLLDRVDSTRKLNGLRGANGHRLAIARTLGLIQVRKRENIVDERRQTARLTVDAAAKGAQVVLTLDHAVRNELGIARDCRKRGLELMGDICRELATHAVVVRQHRHLALELLALRLNALEHGNHLGIGMLVAAAWMVQIHLLQRRNNGTGFATRQEKREHRAGCRDKQHRRHHRQQNRRNAGLSLR